ncbi:hypothetical protein MTO96_016140 [Rhipicephalus appendiculatus]
MVEEGQGGSGVATTTGRSKQPRAASGPVAARTARLAPVTGPLARGAFLAAGGAALNWAPAGIARRFPAGTLQGRHRASCIRDGEKKTPEECLCEFWTKMGTTTMLARIRRRDWPRSHRRVCASPRAN